MLNLISVLAISDNYFWAAQCISVTVESNSFLRQGWFHVVYVIMHTLPLGLDCTSLAHCIEKNLQQPQKYIGLSLHNANHFRLRRRYHHTLHPYKGPCENTRRQSRLFSRISSCDLWTLEPRPRHTESRRIVPILRISCSIECLESYYHPMHRAMSKVYHEVSRTCQEIRAGPTSWGFRQPAQRYSVEGAMAGLAKGRSSKFQSRDQYAFALNQYTCDDNWRVSVFHSYMDLHSGIQAN